MAKQCLTCRHASTREFQLRIRDRRLEKCFLARLPLEGRSERGAFVGVLIGQNGSRRKISPEKVAYGKVF